MSMPVPRSSGAGPAAGLPASAAPRPGFELSALAALFWLTLRQQARGRRLLVLSLLFALPAGLAVLMRSVAHGTSSGVLEFQLVFNLIPGALAPLTALLYATGVIHDEIEEQTLTYLLIRPLPRAALYVTKLLAAVLTTSLLAAAGVTVVYVAIYWGTGDLWGNVLPGRVAKVAVLFALAQVGYCAIFGFISLLTRRSLIAGIAYIIVIEGVLANWPFVLREATVMYYFRVLTLRWLDPAHTQTWARTWAIGAPDASGQIDLTTAASAIACWCILLGVGLVLTVAGGFVFARREFGVKTPG